MRAHEELLVHTGQHYDDELSRVFFEELGIPAPDRELGAGSGSNTEQTARILAALEPVLAELRPGLVLVYGDTNSTLAGALAAAQAGIPVGHVEAGMRSFDRTMPEELNRVLTDHASDLLLCSTQTAVDNLAREGVRGEAHLVGDVMADVSLAFREIAAERSTIVADLGLEPGGYLVGDRPPRRQRRSPRPPRARWSPCSRRCRGRVVFPVHPRTRARLEAAGLLDRLDGLTLVPPLGYLDFLELARDARAILTDSGGVQKEAYLLGVPCVTLRDTTEWVETVDAGWNVLVDLDRDAALAALERTPPARAARAVRRRARRRASPRRGVGLHCAPMKIGVVGLGYVGLPLVVAFAEAGHDVVGVDVDARVVASLGRGRSHIEDVPDERLRAISERFHPTPRYADLAKVDAVVVAVPTPLTPNREPDLQPLIDTGTALANVLQAGQLVVLESTTYPGTTRERFAPAAGGVRPGGRARLPPRLLARADRPGPHRLHAAQHAQDRRRPDRRVPAPRGRALRARLRRGRAGLDAGVGGAHEAAREHLPLGEHRARERAGDPVRPDGHRRLGGGRRGRHQAVRVHVVQARARAWAGTACRSTRSTSPGGRASSTCRRSSSSWPARSTSACRTSASTGSRAPSTSRRSRSRARGWRSWASPTSPAWGTCASRPRCGSCGCCASRAPRSSYYDDFVPELPDLGLRSEWPEDADCVAIVTAHPGLDVERLVQESPLVVDFRGVTRGIEAPNLVRL